MIYFKKFTDRFEVNFTGLFEVNQLIEFTEVTSNSNYFKKLARILILQNASFFTSKEYFTRALGAQIRKDLVLKKKLESRKTG